MAERLHHGRSAAPGLAIGPLVRLVRAVADTGACGTPDQERARLDRAMAQAKADLERLAGADADLGAEILAFQVELLGDPSLVEPAQAAIQSGAGAATAWRAALEAQVQEYEAAEDDYFRARASDLRDLMDRVLSHLGAPAASNPALPPGAILLDRDLTPSRFLAIDWPRLGGAALEAGSPSSHVAMLARARGVPLLTGLGDVHAEAGRGRPRCRDRRPRARSQRAYPQALRTAALGPPRGCDRAASLLQSRPSPPPASGSRSWSMSTIPLPSSDELLAAADGVGLMRTEFLFLGRERLPDEEEQYRAYVGLLDRLAGKPAIIRTLDVGGDKPLPGVSLAAREQPVPGPARPAALPGASRAVPGPASSASPRRLRPPAEGHAADGGGCRARWTRRGSFLDELPRRADGGGYPGGDAARRHHGRDPGRRDRHRHAACRLLLDRQQRPRPVRDGGLARRRRAGRGPGRPAPSGRPAADRAGRPPWQRDRAGGQPVRRHGVRSGAGARSLLRQGLRRLSVAPAALARVKIAVAASGPGMDEPAQASRADAIAAYKMLLRACIERRPSGLRGRLALALGKHKSFVSQITNPAYGVPIPAADLPILVDICHLSAAEREQFLALYRAAHPERQKHLPRPGPVAHELRIALPAVPLGGYCPRGRDADPRHGRTRHPPGPARRGQRQGEGRNR